MAQYSMTIALAPGERARSWLVEHYRRQGNPPMRAVVGLGVLGMGAVLVHRQPTPVAWIALAWGVFLTFRPLVFAAWLYLARRDAKPFVVTVDARGVNIAGEKGARLLPWSDISAFGLGSDYLWYEIRRGPRATLPFRVMQDDRAAIEALFREHVRRPG